MSMVVLLVGGPNHGEDIEVESSSRYTVVKAREWREIPLGGAIYSHGTYEFVSTADGAYAGIWQGWDDEGKKGATRKPGAFQRALEDEIDKAEKDVMRELNKTNPFHNLQGVKW